MCIEFFLFSPEKTIIQTKNLFFLFVDEYEALDFFDYVYKNKCITNDYCDFWLLAFAVWTLAGCWAVELEKQEVKTKTKKHY